MNRTHLKLAKIVAKLLDNQFSILGFKFGLDPLLGLFPGVGDGISLSLGLYIIWAAYQAGVSKDKIKKMVVNSLLDFLVGLIPVVGDVTDFLYKSNQINLRIIEEHFGQNIEEGEVVG